MITRKLLPIADVPTHEIKIERKKITMTDDPAEVLVDGRAYSLSMATDILLQDGAYQDIRYYPYYCWNASGLFRSFAGKFKWYFTLDSDVPNYSNPRTIEIRFANDIDFEHDPIDEIFVELKERLEAARYALFKYDPNEIPLFNSISENALNRYLYEGLNKQI